MKSRLENAQLRDILSRLGSSRNDEAAWRALYDGLWGFVYGAVYRTTRGQVALSQDVSQEVFLRLYSYCPFGELQDPARFRGYLKRMATNRALTAAQREAFRKEVDLKAGGGGDQEESGAYGQAPGADLVKRLELADLLGHEIRALQGDDRELAGMVIMGDSLGEIARHFDVSYAAAATRVYRLRNRLRKTALGRYLREVKG